MDAQTLLNNYRANKGTAPDPQELLNQYRSTTVTPLTTPKKSLGGFVSNAVSSTASGIGGLLSPVIHPIKTFEGLTNLVGGVIQKGGGAIASAVTGKNLMPDTLQTRSLDALPKYFSDKYGSFDKIKETAYNDPFGFALDAATLLTGGGAAVAKVGEISKIAKLAEAGNVISKVGDIVNPITQVTKGIGKVSELATTGKTLGGQKYISDVIPSAGRIGIPSEDLPISTLTKSPVSTGLESVAAKGFGGDKIVKNIENVYNKMNEKIDSSIAGTPSPTDLGKNLSKAADDFKNSFFEQKQKLYNEASLPLNKKGTGPLFEGSNGTMVPAADARETLSKAIATEKNVLSQYRLKTSPKLQKYEGLMNDLSGKLELANMTDTKDVLNNLIKTEKQALKGYGVNTSPELKTYEGLLKGLNDPTITTSDINRTLQKIEGDLKYGTLLKTGNTAKLSLIQQTLDAEFIKTLKIQRPDLADSLEKADAYMKQGMQKINSGVIQAIIKNADKPDVIVDSLLPKIESLEDIKNLNQVIGEKNMVGVRQQILSNIFDKSKGVGSENLTPTGISRQIRAFGDDKLQAVLDPRQYQLVKDLEKVSLAMGKGQKILGGSQTAYLAKIGLSSGAMFGALGMLVSGNIPGFVATLSAVMGDIAFNKFISSDLGRKLLTQGVQLSGKTGATIQKYASQIGKTSLFGQQNKNIQDSYQSIFGQQAP